MAKNEAIMNWFATHPLFSINGMCKLIKIDTSNFTRNLSSGNIPDKHIPKIEKIIKQYGFKN